MFRQCVDGEILVNNQCQLCPSGSYSFHYDSLHPPTQCTKCPLFTADCYGTTILALPGYWRIDRYSLEMLKCPYGAAACHGGEIGSSLSVKAVSTESVSLSVSVPPVPSFFLIPTALPTSYPTGLIKTTSAQGCAVGYEGPLCGVCSDNYYFASTGSTCTQCKGNGEGQLAALILIPLLLIVLVVYFTFTTFLGKDIAQDSIVKGFIGTKPMDALSGGNVVEISAVTFKAACDKQTSKISDDIDESAWSKNRPYKEVFRVWLSKVIVVMAPKLKIMLTVFQIISSLQFTLNITFTAIATKLFHAFR